MIRYKFTEADKTSKIQKHPNLSDEQKEELIEFFKTHTDQHNLIDWNRFNKMTYEEIHEIIDTWEKTHLLPKDRLEDLKEGVDYEYLGEDNGYKFYFIYTYRASVAFASNNIGPEVWNALCSWYIHNVAGEETNWEQNVLYDYPQKKLDGGITYGGAKWCISMNHTQRFWREYTIDNGYSFVFAISNSSMKDSRLNKLAIELNGTEVKDTYKSNDVLSDISVANYLKNSKVQGILKECLNREEKLREEEAERKEISEFKKKTKGLEVKQFTYYGNKFPMVEMGERAEGKVFGSYYLTASEVPFSPCYDRNSPYECGCNHWDISIARQWLNSDLPAGQWFKEHDVDGYKADWDSMSYSLNRIKNFINFTDGFLRIIGLSKSQLNPVKNVTYTTEGKEIITEDYVWIPSLTELSTQNKYKEGEPLDYWKKLFGDNASHRNNDLRVMKSCDDLLSHYYWTRSANLYFSQCTNDIDYLGGVYKSSAYNRVRLPVLACFKS